MFFNLVVVIFAFTLHSFAAETPKAIVRDPILVGKAWGTTDTSLLYNDRYEKRGKWQIRFDRKSFARLTGNAGISMLVKRVVPSPTEQGKAELVVESGGGTYVFETTDFGLSWRVAKMPENKEAKPVEVRAEASRPISPVAAPRGSGEAVDLNALNSGSSASSPSSHSGSPHGGTTHASVATGSAAPMFKILFDLLLHLRPGITPLTFDNYHGLLLVDFIPKPEIQFSFEVRPDPRYYEFDYQLSKAWQLRLGRIWIPFDDMNPHNTFGGLINTTRVNAGAPFLPDIWTDLGVGVKWKPIDTQSLVTTFHAYVVNGFQAGGTDPTGQVTIYPNFGGSTGTDNNTDKAMGARGHFLFAQMFGLGASFYTGRYTNEADEAKRLMMIGVDGSMRFPSGTSLKGGYTFHKVDLVTGAGKTDFIRGGAYVEATQRFQRHYLIGGRFGVQQGDDRVTDLNDQTWLTGRIGYETDIWQLYLIYAKDLNSTPDKSYKEMSAARFVVTL